MKGLQKVVRWFLDANDNPNSHQNIIITFWHIYNVPWNLHANLFRGICIKSTNQQAKSMRKQLISFAQVIKFCKISSSRGLFNPPPLRTPLVRDIVTPPGSWSFLGRFSGGVAKGLASPVLPGKFLSHCWTIVAEIFIWRSDSTLWLYEFQSCALCREVSHRELFAKIPSLLLALFNSILQSLPKIHDHRWGSEQRPNWNLIL